MEGRSVPTEPLALRRLALPWVLAFVRERGPHTAQGSAPIRFHRIRPLAL